MEDENNLILSRLLKISFQIFKVNCFILYFTSVDRTKLSYRTLAEEILRTAGSGDSGYIWRTGNTESQALFQEWAEPLTTLLSKKHPKARESFFFLLCPEPNKYPNIFFHSCIYSLTVLYDISKLSVNDKLCISFTMFFFSHSQGLLKVLWGLPATCRCKKMRQMGQELPLVVVLDCLLQSNFLQLSF